MSERVVVNLVGDPGRGMLAESRLVDDQFAYGGVLVSIGLAFAVAAAGHEVELRGRIPRVTYERFARAVDAAPRVDVPPRDPEASDVVVVPEGWKDPLEYAQLALSPARVWLFVLAAPGLFGWPFTEERWSQPDPLTVDLSRLARPEHFQGMQALGLRLLTHSTGIAQAAQRAGVDCLYVGAGQPVGFPEPDGERDVDVVGLMENRWAPLAERAFADVGSDVTVDRVPAVPNAEVLRRFGRARILVWPSRVEGHATIPIEARAMGCVPVALSTNVFAAGLTEEAGVVAVSSVDEIAPAIRGLLADPALLEQLSTRGRSWAREHDAWDPFVSRVRGWLATPSDPRPGHGARVAAGAAFRSLIEPMATPIDELRVAKSDLTEATRKQEQLIAELDWLRGRKLVDWAYRFDRFVRRR